MQHKVLIVVMDGVGLISPEQGITNAIQSRASVLPPMAFYSGNAINAAFTPHLSQLFNGPHFRTLSAHGLSVGLPTWEDMGNSEVGHNTMGAGRIFAQGSSLVNTALANGNLFKGRGWQDTVNRNALLSGKNTLHFCGLLSDGNVHSHIDHLFALLIEAKKQGVMRVRIHILLDGRDVPMNSAEKYIASLEEFLKTHANPKFDCKIASGGGRMSTTMDRYNSDWSIVERGYNAHVVGKGEQFTSAAEAIASFRSRSYHNDQELPGFVIVDEGGPIGKVQDDDSFILFNFRGDRAIQISRALTENNFTEFKRSYFPKIHFAGMMQYDGDLKIPNVYLVDPPQIENTLGEILAANKIKQFACSETQKYGHVTYFWNGNRSGKFSEDLEQYLEIPSDQTPFHERPWMHSAEICDATIKNMYNNTFQVGRINFANGDMVGHTGDFAAATIAISCVDLAIGRLMRAAKETNTILIVTADHGNADEMYEKNKKTNAVVFDAQKNPIPKTSHTLAPVPFAIFNGELLEKKFALRSDLPKAGLANIAATVLELIQLNPPKDYEPSLLTWNEVYQQQHDNPAQTQASVTNLNQLTIGYSVGFWSSELFKTVQKLRAPNGCPWDKAQTFESLQPFTIEEAYEVTEASQELNKNNTPENAVHFADELGDLLLQVFLNSAIAEEQSLFETSKPFELINEKMIRRHPHVFEKSIQNIQSSKDVEDIWKEIKKKEKTSGTTSSNIFDDVKEKKSLPTLIFGVEIAKKARKVGFCYPSLKEVFEQFLGEVDELKAEFYAPQQNWEKFKDELGDIFVTLSNLTAYLQKYDKNTLFDLDQIARNGFKKFLTRFQKMEEIFEQTHGTPLTSETAQQMTLKQWDVLWQLAKKQLSPLSS